jgi:uncharacterized glyoxalase superfamily protein PhnB
MATSTRKGTAARRPAAKKKKAAKPAKGRARAAGFRSRRQPESLRLRAIMPSMTVTDLAASVRWYRDVVGFVVAEEMSSNGKVAAVRLRAGTCQLLLGQDDFAKGRDRQKGVAIRLYCTTTQEVDRLASDIERRGGVLAQKPTDQPWGARDFSLTDPDGFKLSISNWQRE